MYHQSLAEVRQTELGDVREIAITGLVVNGAIDGSIHAAQPSRFEFDVSARVSFAGFRMFLIIENPQGITVLHSVINERTHHDVKGEGVYHVTVDVPPLWLTAGMYSAHVKLICNGIGLSGRYFSDKLLLSVESDYDPDAAPGLLTPPVTWQVAAPRRSTVEIPEDAGLAATLVPSLPTIHD
jgi:hypothetical protein